MMEDGMADDVVITDAGLVASLSQGFMSPAEARAITGDPTVQPVGTFTQPPAQREVSPAYVESIVEQLLPRVVDELRRRCPPEALGLAQDAASVPGLDETCLSLLADWMEDQRWPGLAHKVRQLKAGDGDLFVVRVDGTMTDQARAHLNRHCDGITERLAAAGRRVVFVVLHDGLTIEQFRAGAALGKA